MSTLIRKYACVAMILCLSVSVQAQYALFRNNTDTILIAGNTTLDNAATYEANIRFTSDSLGMVFNEWESGREDKQFFAGSTGLIGYAHPVNITQTLRTTFSPLSDDFHHLAYVYDGSQERLYVDGALKAARSASGSIWNSAGSVGVVGALMRPTLVNAFQGYIDTLRISDVARYQGESFIAPTGDLSPDANTQLLYNFNEAPGSARIVDLSGNGRTGLLGVGFAGATAPRLVPAPNALLTAMLGVFPGLVLLLRRHRKAPCHALYHTREHTLEEEYPSGVSRTAVNL